MIGSRPIRWAELVFAGAQHPDKVGQVLRPCRQGVNTESGVIKTDD
jgi:hypothetical protein